MQVIISHKIFFISNYVGCPVEGWYETESSTKQCPIPSLEALNPLTDIKEKSNKRAITAGGADDIKAQRNTLNQAAQSILPAELQKTNEVDP